MQIHTHPCLSPQGACSAVFSEWLKAQRLGCASRRILSTMSQPHLFSLQERNTERQSAPRNRSRFLLSFRSMMTAIRQSLPQWSPEGGGRHKRQSCGGSYFFNARKSAQSAQSAQISKSRDIYLVSRRLQNSKKFKTKLEEISEPYKFFIVKLWICLWSKSSLKSSTI